MILILLAGCGGNLADPSVGQIKEPTFVMSASARDEDASSYECSFRSDETCDSQTACDCSQLPGTAQFQQSTGVLQWTPPDSASAPYAVTISNRAQHCLTFLVDPLQSGSDTITLTGTTCQ